MTTAEYELYDVALYSLVGLCCQFILFGCSLII
jgi:hypothetical protein